MSSFRVVCILHAAIGLLSGCYLLFRSLEMGKEEGEGAKMLIMMNNRHLGSTPHDQLLLNTSVSLIGVCFVIIGGLIFMVSFVKDHNFQSFFAKGCILLHLLLAAWRFHFERKVEEFAYDWPLHILGDALLSLSWVLFMVWNWREKYD